MTYQFPRPLVQGDCVAVVSPASTPKPEPVERAIEQLHSFGLRTKTYGDVYRSHGYLAGTDDERAAELMQAYLDPDVAAILPTRGGYGITRLLHLLDYEAIAANPKILIGYSDITALHLALRHKTSQITFHGPHLQDGIGSPERFDLLTSEAYDWALWGRDQATGKVSEAAEFAIDNRRLRELQLPELECLRPGNAEGPIVGGNLALVGATLGSQYEIDTAGCVLFLEDISELPYRVDRLLSQLRLCGKFDKLVGVILGHFNDCESESDKPSLTLDQVIADYFGTLDVPVLKGFPCGHAQPNVTLPYGGKVTIDADQGVVRFRR